MKNVVGKKTKGSAEHLLKWTRRDGLLEGSSVHMTLKAPQNLSYRGFKTKFKVYL